MSKETSPQQRKAEAKAFAKEHWPILAAASSVAGASILLLIKYYRYRKSIDGSSEPDPDDLLLNEEDARLNIANTPMFLNNGLPTVESIEHATEYTQDLAEGLEDEEEKSWLRALGKLRK